MAQKYLSKSTFIKGVQCEKALYLHKYHSNLSDDINDSLSGTDEIEIVSALILFE